MECYSEQSCAVFVDGELPATEARQLRDHMATCQRCRELVEALRAENLALVESLSELPDPATAPAVSSRQPWSLTWGKLAAMAAVLALASIISLWFDELSIPPALDWVNPFSLSGFMNLIFDFADYVAHGGVAMLADYAAVVGVFSLLLLLGGGALLLARRARLLPNVLMVTVLLGLSLPGYSLERRHGDFVTVAANETVDDTLFVTGKTLRIDGVINGDLLVAGRNVEVRGTIKGDLLSWADRVEVRGTVEGRIYCLSHSLDMSGQVDHSIYGAMQSLLVTDGSHVGEGIVVATADASLEGDVKRSVTVATGSAAVSGAIGRDLTMVGRSLTLSNTARIGGNLSARVRDMKDVHIADGATLAGKRDIQLQPKNNRFAHHRFYFHQVLWFAAAMLVGWLGVVLFPIFFQATTREVSSGWRNLALGIAVLAGAPVAMVLAAITLIGIPASFMLLAVYLVALYLAKIWVGAFLGRVLLNPAGTTTRDWLLGLLVGLLILSIVELVPFLGGFVRLAVLLIGLGAFAANLYRARASQPATV